MVGMLVSRVASGRRVIVGVAVVVVGFDGARLAAEVRGEWVW